MPSGEVLIELCRARMPFGKYRGVRLVRLPEAYLAWFKRQGMPKGKLGEQLESALVVRSSGLEPLLAPILEALDRGGSFPGRLSGAGLPFGREVG